MEQTNGFKIFKGSHKEWPGSTSLYKKDTCSTDDCHQNHSAGNANKIMLNNLKEYWIKESNDFFNCLFFKEWTDFTKSGPKIVWKNLGVCKRGGHECKTDETIAKNNSQRYVWETKPTTAK